MYGPLWFVKEMFEAAMKMLRIFYIIIVIAIVAIIAAVIAGLIFFTKITIIILVICSLMVVGLALCRAASLGNIYCPQCGSEDNVPADIHCVDEPDKGRIFRVCNSCKRIW